MELLVTKGFINFIIISLEIKYFDCEMPNYTNCS